MSAPVVERHRVHYTRGNFDLFSAADPLRAALARVRSRTTGGRSAVAGSSSQGVAPEEPISSVEMSERMEQLAAALPQQPRIHPLTGVVVVIAGFGPVGVTIAGEMARRGCIVRIFDNDASVRGTAIMRVQQEIMEHQDAGLLLEGDLEVLTNRVEVVQSLRDALGGGGAVGSYSRSGVAVGARLVLEAIPEAVPIKQAFYMEMVEACVSQGVSPEQIIFGSNTLSTALHDIVTHLPDEWAARVVGMRSLFPSWFIDEVELTMGHQWCQYTGRPDAGASQFSAQVSRKPPPPRAPPHAPPPHIYTRPCASPPHAP